MKFDLKPAPEKPSREYRKGSKCDPILDAFMEGSESLVTVDAPDKDANYPRTQLNKRIGARKLKAVKVPVVNEDCYLEKKKTPGATPSTPYPAPTAIGKTEPFFPSFDQE